jgi:hypothetical protein
MFYTRINKIKVFNNREGFLGLFNRGAELRIYSHVSSSNGQTGYFLENGQYVPALSISISDLLSMDEKEREEVDYTLFGFENIIENSMYAGE